MKKTISFSLFYLMLFNALLFAYPIIKIKGCKVWLDKDEYAYVSLTGIGHIKNWDTYEFEYTYKDLSPIKKVWNNDAAKYLYIEKEKSKWILYYGDNIGDIWLKMIYPIMDQTPTLKLIYEQSK